MGTKQKQKKRGCGGVMGVALILLTNLFILVNQNPLQTITETGDTNILNGDQP